MQGWYILPNIRHEIGKQNLHSVEFSCRYEQWDNDKQDHNIHYGITPALSFEFIKNYNLRLTLALEMNRYSYTIPETSTYNSDIFTTQSQARF